MTLHLLHLKNLPILEQLKLEEALLRADDRNFVLINEGSSPAIVMGISGKAEELIDLSKLESLKVPVIRRFSGGGTVIVDEHTLFVTFICHKDLHKIPPYPEPILRWSETFYKQVFSHPLFALRENDYVFGEKKFGGNAQYIQKERWLHHTSFLWDYSPARMQCLLPPKKAPAYRAGRGHEEFLCTLSSHYPSRDLIVHEIHKQLRARYTVIDISLDAVQHIKTRPHRQATTVL